MEPIKSRTTSEDLADRLQESLIWIDLRTKLMTLLAKQSEEGDKRASDQLNFVASVWPGGGAPRSAELNKLAALCRKMLEELNNQSARLYGPEPRRWDELETLINDFENQFKEITQ